MPPYLISANILSVCVNSLSHLFKSFCFLKIKILSFETFSKVSTITCLFFLLYVATYFIKVKFKRSLQPGISGLSLLCVLNNLLKNPFNCVKVE